MEETVLIDGTAVQFAVADPDVHGRIVALVATAGEDVVGMARYDRLPGGDQARLALEVEEDFQGRGLGTALLQRLATFAHDRGIARLVAITAPEHQRVRRVVRRAGFQAASVYDGRTVKVAFSTAPVPDWWRGTY
jgi:RimJ/RimL family protein N-acetyltransferase